jgi:hypothetical protein
MYSDPLRPIACSYCRIFSALRKPNNVAFAFCRLSLATKQENLPAMPEPSPLVVPPLPVPILSLGVTGHRANNSDFVAHEDRIAAVMAFGALGDVLLDAVGLQVGAVAFLVGHVIAITLYARRQQVNPLSLGDLIAPVAPLGLFFGRIANFINGELWGRETNVPWAVRFCNDRIQQMYGFCPAGDAPRHPSQLYEAGLEGIVLFGLLSLAIWKGRLLMKPGYITGLFLVGYGVCRALLENVREPDYGMPDFPLGLTMGMMLSIPMILVGLWLIWRARSRPPVVA